jgi:hypothetical protein
MSVATIWGFIRSKLGHIALIIDAYRSLADRILFSQKEINFNDLGGRWTCNNGYGTSNNKNTKLDWKLNNDGVFILSFVKSDGDSAIFNISLNYHWTVCDNGKYVESVSPLNGDYQTKVSRAVANTFHFDFPNAGIAVDVSLKSGKIATALEKGIYKTPFYDGEQKYTLHYDLQKK